MTTAQAAGAIPSYPLLLGNGRMSAHLAHYFTLLGIPFDQWKTPRLLTQEFFARVSARPITQIWILVSDSAIESVARDLQQGLTPCPPLIHASGALTIPGVQGAHPLMTFGRELYPLSTYRDIPWVLEKRADAPDPTPLFSDLPNAKHLLAPEHRALYHALVSIAGNFPAILWSEVFRRFESDLGLPATLLLPFVLQSLFNILPPGSGRDALTGPLVRGDLKTIDAHVTGLGDSPLVPLYRSFELFLSQTAASQTGESAHVLT